MTCCAGIDEELWNHPMTFTAGNLKVLKVLPIPLLKEKEAIFSLGLHCITLKRRMAPEETRLREIHHGVWMLSCSFQMVVESNYAIASCFLINITRGYTPVNQRWYLYQIICRLYYEITQRIHLPSMWAIKKNLSEPKNIWGSPLICATMVGAPKAWKKKFKVQH